MLQAHSLGSGALHQSLQEETTEPAKEGKEVGRERLKQPVALTLFTKWRMFTSWRMSFYSPPLSRLSPTAPWQVAGKPKPTPCCVTLHLSPGREGWPTGMLGNQSRGKGRCSGGIKKGCTRFDVSRQLKDH